MRAHPSGFLLLALSVGVSYGQGSSSCSDILVPEYEIPAVHPAWTAQLVMTDLAKPRTIHIDSEGALIILDSGVGVRHVTFTDHGGTCLEVDTDEIIIEMSGLNHGLAFSLDGRTLYASTVESVLAWSYDPESGTVSGDPTVVIDGMSSNQHVTRTLVMSQHSPGHLIVSRGSNENLAAESLKLDSGMSQIRAFNINDTDAYPIDFLDGRVLGWGLRNSVGVAEDPVTGNIYSVENSVDGIERNGELIKEDNPGEELNFHGTLDDEEHDGDDAPNYGYPHCYAVWDADDIPDHDGLEVGEQFAIDTNDTLDDETCHSQYTPPRLSFPAHTAPLDLIFNENGTEAWISFHGSFDREDPQGYTLSTISFRNGEPTEPPNSTTSLTHIISMTDLSTCPRSCFRPVGLAWDPQGRLFVTSDTTGEIFILQRRREEGGGGATATQSGTLVQPTGTGSSDGGDDDDDGGDGGDEDEGDDNAAAGLSAVQSLGLVAAAFVTAFCMSF